MRVKTEDRRRAIMKAAAEVFQEEGFSGATMAMISARVGGSKATLYNYFSSKEELFAAITLEALDSTAQAMINLLEGEVCDIRETLLQFGHAYLSLITSPDVIMVTKIAISHGPAAPLGPRLYADGPAKGWRTIAASLERFDQMGLLRVDDPKTAAFQLKSLLEAGTFEPMLFGARPYYKKGEAVAQAIDLFLLKYQA